MHFHPAKETMDSPPLLSPDCAPHYNLFSCWWSLKPDADRPPFSPDNQPEGKTANRICCLLVCLQNEWTTLKPKTESLDRGRKKRKGCDQIKCLQGNSRKFTQIHIVLQNTVTRLQNFTACYTCCVASVFVPKLVEDHLLNIFIVFIIKLFWNITKLLPTFCYIIHMYIIRYKYRELIAKLYWKYWQIKRQWKFALMSPVSTNSRLRFTSCFSMDRYRKTFINLLLKKFCSLAFL